MSRTQLRLTDIKRATPIRLKWVLLQIWPLAVIACSTHRPSTIPGHGSGGGEPTIRLHEYKSVQTRRGQNGDVAVALAISGGGQRAANFAIGVMRALEKLPTRDGDFNLLREVDYFSTVSGGGLAAAAYITSLDKHLATGRDLASYSLNDALSHSLGSTAKGSSRVTLLGELRANYHRALLRGMFSFRSIGALDRGDFLERALDDHALGAAWSRNRSVRSLTLGDVFTLATSEREPTLPMWICNSTVFENGAIFPFTPDQLAEYQITEYSHRLQRVKVAQEQRPELPRDYVTVPLAVGLTASAAFPFAIPAITLSSRRDPENPYLHLIDGGGADNVAVMTALRLLQSDPTPNKVLIVIDAYRGVSDPFSRGRGAPWAGATLRRMMSISLDSSHQRYRDVVATAARADRIYFAELSISTLLAQWQPKPHGIADADLSRLYRDARSIGTWLATSAEQQNVLVQAGEAAVALERKILGRLIESRFRGTTTPTPAPLHYRLR